MQSLSIRYSWGMDQFCQLTSLHGWNYCFRKEKPKTHTVGWILVIITAIISAIALVAGIILEFNAATVSVTLDTTTAPLDDFMFPAVAICNVMQIRKSVVNRLVSELGNVTDDEIVDVSSLMIQLRYGTLTNETIAIRDRIIASDVLSELLDELIQIYSTRKVTEEEIDRMIPFDIGKWHFNFDKGQTVEKTRENFMALYPQLVTQLNPIDMVSNVWMAGATATEFSKGVNTDFGDTCLWMPFMGTEATKPE